ncbi:uncharacterized protein LOC121235477 [Juglans microcarpa x Juglans regia]|uniref:uncharacterized protein LOC121235477 n=1 Tax=Juglans microcarpa x Juglans regia TaxID=2249226 RepID=UPI001B7DC5A9|nr:uncharacterized protein LOC121235477 [Juglans microcarpa x Juglans regia]
MDGLEDQWRKFRLTEEEEVVLEINSSGGEEISRKGNRSLIGKVCTDRVVGKDLISNKMAKIWRIVKRATFQEVNKNIFTIMFETHVDMHIILEGKPWTFDNALLQIHDLPLGCMTMEWGTQIGGSMGRVLEVDVEEDGIGWRSCLRVRVEVSLYKAIARGRFISYQGSKLWVQFRYENLPKICLKCG